MPTETTTTRPPTELETLQQQIKDLQAKRELSQLKRQIAQLESEQNRPPLPESIQTISDFFSNLQRHAELVESGLMDAEQARSLARIHGHQLKAAELQLQYARIFKGRTPDPEMRLIAAAKTEAK